MNYSELSFYARILQLLLQLLNIADLSTPYPRRLVAVYPFQSKQLVTRGGSSDGNDAGVTCFFQDLFSV